MVEGIRFVLVSAERMCVEREQQGEGAALSRFVRCCDDLPRDPEDPKTPRDRPWTARRTRGLLEATRRKANSMKCPKKVRFGNWACSVERVERKSRHWPSGNLSCSRKPDQNRYYFFGGFSRVNQQTYWQRDAADMSAASHSRHVCCAKLRTCLLCGTANVSAV